MTPQQIIERFVRTTPGSVAADTYAQRLIAEIEHHGYSITKPAAPLHAPSQSPFPPPDHHVLPNRQWNYVIDGFGVVGILFFVATIVLVIGMRDFQLWMGMFAISVGCFMISVGGFMMSHRHDGEKDRSAKAPTNQNKLQ